MTSGGAFAQRFAAKRGKVRAGQARRPDPCSDRLEMTTVVRIDRAHRNGSEPALIRFCTRCGEQGDPAAKRQRVCERCGMGVVLTCASDALPGTAFLICTHELTVRAVSQAGERYFGRESSVLGSTLLDVLSCPLGDDQLARHAALAAQRTAQPVIMPLRPVAGAGVRRLGTLTARIATCGPPRAALVTVEPSEFGRS